MPVHVLVFKNVIPACLQNTSSLTMCQQLLLQNLLPAGGQLVINTDQQVAAMFHQGGVEICIWLSASRMQTIENLGILYSIATSQVQFASGW